jgi:hypothetical protein
MKTGVVIVLAVAVAGGGYLLYQRHKKTVAAATANTANVVATQIQAPAEAARVATTQAAQAAYNPAAPVATALQGKVPVPVIGPQYTMPSIFAARSRLAALGTPKVS